MTFYGNRDEKHPWKNPEAPKFFGNELRRCAFVGLGLSYFGPVPPWGCAQLHVLTAWGDEMDAEELQSNPSFINVTDSDDSLLEAGDEVKTYVYDDYYYPREPHDGEGWYLDDYWLDVHPYIMNVVTLKEAQYNFPHYCEAMIVVGSYQIEQQEPENAEGLHYHVFTDNPIYGYKMEIDWEPHGDSTVVADDEEPTDGYVVDWDLSVDPVPTDSSVTITTEFALCGYNKIYYEDIYFTYDGGGSKSPSANGNMPSFGWEIETDDLLDQDIDYICGGFVTGAFEIYADAAGTMLIGRNRLEHEYNYYSDPEQHTFTLHSLESSTTLYIGNMRFGHSYGYLEKDELWALGPEDWFEESGAVDTLPPGGSLTVVLNWEGLLPYPRPICLTGSSDEPEMPQATKLYQNYPNPFNPVTTIRYDLPDDGHVTLEVFDLLGRKVATLVDERQEAGSRSVDWRVDKGISSGVYFYSLKANGSTRTRKMVILR